MSWRVPELEGGTSGIDEIEAGEGIEPSGKPKERNERNIWRPEYERGHPIKTGSMEFETETSLTKLAQ